MAYYHPRQKHFRVNVTNTYQPTLNWLKELFGGSVNRCLQNNPLGKKRCYNWCITGQAAYNFLEAIIPYMRENRELAEFVLIMWDIRFNTEKFKRMAIERKSRWGRAAAETKREGTEKSVMQ